MSREVSWTNMVTQVIKITREITPEEKEITATGTQVKNKSSWMFTRMSKITSIGEIIQEGRLPQIRGRSSPEDLARRIGRLPRKTRLPPRGKVTPGGEVTSASIRIRNVLRRITRRIRFLQLTGLCMENRKITPIGKVTPGSKVTQGGNVNQVTPTSIQTQNTRMIEIATWESILRIQLRVPYVNWRTG